MSHTLFSQNPRYSADIIRGYKPDFTPRVAFILGSGLGALAEQIEDAVAISYEKLRGSRSAPYMDMRGTGAGESGWRSCGLHERAWALLRRSRYDGDDRCYSYP